MPTLHLATVFVQRGNDTVERLPHNLDGDQAKNEATLCAAWREVRQAIIDQGTVELSRVDQEILAAMKKRKSVG